MSVSQQTVGTLGTAAPLNGCERPLALVGPESTPKALPKATSLKIPGYQILGVIHEGVMGTVFKARQLSVDRIVAIKVLSDGYARDPEFVQRFRREAKIAAKLTHPNVVLTIDAGDASDGRPYLVMEYVEGETVRSAIERRGAFEEHEAVRLVLAVAEALRFAHRRGLIHRDVKPANLILTENGVKLADLGLARSIDDATWALSEAGMAIGTPEYISPEQVRGQIDVDIRTDIYSLGATLYQMVTGRVPYGGDTTAEAIRRHVDPKIPLPPPSTMSPTVSGSLCAVIRTMMAWNRAERYRDPDELILDLQNLLHGPRPLIAGLAPDAFADLATGDPLPPPVPVVPEQVIVPEEPPAEPPVELPPEVDVDARTWRVLFVVPAVSLACALLTTALLIVAR